MVLSHFPVFFWLIGTFFVTSTEGRNDLIRTSATWLASSVTRTSFRSQPTGAKEGGQHPSIPTSQLIFPGGGIFFYWQAGVITFLREQGYDLSNVALAGASAGALAATLTATDVGFYEATDLALRKAKEAGVWERKGGLQGIWGPLIREWLHELLPEHAAEMSQSRNLSLLVTPVPLILQKTQVRDFKSKQDLIDANMASVHLPFFLDGRITSNFRQQPHIDGSFLAEEQDYMCDMTRKKDNDTENLSIIRVDYNKDPKYQQTAVLDFVQALQPDDIYAMLEDGKAFARIMEMEGCFHSLPRRV